MWVISTVIVGLLSAVNLQVLVLVDASVAHPQELGPRVGPYSLYLGFRFPHTLL